LSSQFRRHLHTDVQELDSLLPDLAGFLEQNGVEPSVTYVVQLAVEELVLNVIRHGSHGDTNRNISLGIDLDDARHAMLEVVDDADAFDPRTTPEPDFDEMLLGARIGGLGIHLVRSLVASLDYQRVDNKNRVRLRILPLPASPKSS
jgi:anti-sigma regulatory factor (Ser/Thr protein kinase)